VTVGACRVHRTRTRALRRATLGEYEILLELGHVACDLYSPTILALDRKCDQVLCALLLWEKGW